MITIGEVKRIRWYRQAGAAVPLTFFLPVLSIYAVEQFVTFTHDCALVLELDGSWQFVHCYDADAAREEAKKAYRRCEEDPAFFERVERELHANGTQVASRVLKDGMLVEVDADTGIVRIRE